MFIICVLFVVACFVLEIEEIGAIPLIGAFACVVLACVFIAKLVSARDIDERIAMYEEQNTKIETQVGDAVKSFMAHENEVFKDASPESYITLVALYPDLKSDALMEELIKTYSDNNRKICELKEEKIKIQRSKFWLYFGK